MATQSLTGRGAAGGYVSWASTLLIVAPLLLVTARGSEAATVGVSAAGASVGEAVGSAVGSGVVTTGSFAGVPSPQVRPSSVAKAAGPNAKKAKSMHKSRPILAFLYH